MRWSRGVVLLLCAAMTLVGCGTNDPTTAGVYDDGASGPGVSPGDGSSSAEPAGTASAGTAALRPLGQPIDVGGLRVTVRTHGVGGDEDGPWLKTTMRVENRGDKALGLPSLGLKCAEPATFGYMAGEARSLRPGRSTEVEVSLLISNLPDEGAEEDGYYDPIGPCEGPASISVSVSSGRPDYVQSESDGWRVDTATLEALNARLPFTRPGGEPKDPDRPYAWTEADVLSSGYQVVSVPRMTLAEALRILDPVRGVRSSDDLRRVVVDELDGGVVLFTYGFILDRYVRALSRGGIAASYSTTVEGDDHVLLARRGRIVRSFDPFAGQDYLKTEALPEEKGLDLRYDSGPTSWTLLERLTGITITEDWVLDDSHPGFLLRD